MWWHSWAVLWHERAFQSRRWLSKDKLLVSWRFCWQRFLLCWNISASASSEGNVPYPFSLENYTWFLLDETGPVQLYIQVLEIGFFPEVLFTLFWEVWHSSHFVQMLREWILCIHASRVWSFQGKLGVELDRLGWWSIQAQAKHETHVSKT